jgi:hypothetical protein
MPAPSSSLATLRPDLAASFMDFDLAADQKGFVGLDILTVIEAPRQAGNFGRIPLSQLLTNRDDIRAPGSGYARGNWTFEPQVYSCVEHGAEEPVDDRERNQYADYFDTEVISAARARDIVVRNNEINIIAAIEAGGIPTQGVSNGAWSGGQDSSATPLEDINTACNTVWETTGLWPNCLVIERRCFRNLRILAEVTALLKYNGLTDVKASKITAQILAECFDIEKVIIAGSAKNTANEGQTVSIASIWNTQHALVCRVANSEDMREPCLGRTFHWGEDGSSIGGTMESYRDERVRGDVIRVRHDVGYNIIYPTAAVMITGVQ